MKTNHLYICLFFIIISGCNDKKETEIPINTHNRTIIVYLGRDNSDLHQEWEDKKEAMISGWNGNNGNLIIFEDLKDHGASMSEVRKNNGTIHITELEISDIGDNSADPEVFSSVIKKIITLYPADSYGLIVFFHGTGWLPKGTFESPRSIIKDNESEMEISDFASALPDNLKLDFIIFEACLMAGIEVVYELRDKADYILASAAEIVSPGFKSIYKNYMDHLFLPNADLYRFSAEAFDYFNTQTGSWQSGTLSLIRTSDIYEMGQWLKNNINREKIGSVDIDDIQQFDRRASNHLYYDFEDFFSRILTEGARKEILHSFLDKCIEYKASTPYFF